MGLLTVSTLDDYKAAIRALFPEGQFWEDEFADATSELSLWCEARAVELLRFKTRRAELLEEGLPRSASELLENWERGVGLPSNLSLTLQQRRQAVVSISSGGVPRQQLDAACAIFGATLDDMKFPFKPAYFGRAHFGDRIATPAALSTLWLFISLPDDSMKVALETFLESILLANQIIVFFYKDGNNGYVS